MMPLLTIAIPVYNRAEEMMPTLESVAAQTYRPLDIVLIDNASTDGTFDAMCRWRDANSAADFNIRVISEPIKGLSRARNAALLATRTEWLMPFDSDDIMLPAHVARAMETLHDNPNADIIGWDQEFHMADGRVCTAPFRLQQPWFYTICDSNLSNLRFMAKTELYKQAGAWDESLQITEDLDLGLRLLRLNPKIVKATGEPTCIIQCNNISQTRGDTKAILKKSIDDWRILMPRIPCSMHKYADFYRIYNWAGRRSDISTLGIQRSDWTTGNVLWRMILKTMYHYVSHGGRGARKLFFMFFDKNRQP